MMSIGFVQQEQLGAVKLPALSLEGVSKVWQAGFLTTIATFAILFLGFFAARAAGVSALSHDGLTTQVASSALIILPFSLYTLWLSSRRGLQAVGLVGAMIALLFGALLAGVV